MNNVKITVNSPNGWQTLEYPDATVAEGLYGVTIVERGGRTILFPYGTVAFIVQREVITSDHWADQLLGANQDDGTNL